MALLQRALVLLATVGVAVPASVQDAGRVSAPVPKNGPSVQTASYTPDAKEFYLTSDQQNWIRPGLKFTFVAVTDLAPSKKPTVEFTITDDLNQPIDRLGALTPGVVSIRFTVATWDAATRSYTNQIVANGNPSRDNTGTFVQVEVGRYKYTFANAMPATFDPTKPATVFAGLNRNLTDLLGKTYYVNTFKDLVPATGAAATTFTAVTLGKCNACHDPLALHGGNYRDIKTCVLCHNPNNMTGSNAHFNGQVFFHALHQGKDSVVGPGPTYPQDIRNCQNCHDGTQAGGADWYTNPSRAACGSCHNDIDWSSGANHAAGAQANDSKCAECHVPQGDREWDASIKNAHIVPLKSKQLKGYNAQVVSVDNVGPGKKPVVTFKLTNGDGSIVDPTVYKTTTNGSLNIVLAGPSTDYGSTLAPPGQPFRENAGTSANLTFNGTVGVYTFTNAIPANAKGTWAVSIETRRPYTLNPAPAKGPATVNEGAVNVPKYIAVTDATPVARRTVVQLNKCNACHDRLDILFSHGNQRIAIDHCVICHNANGEDSNRRPADGSANPAENISFARMIHRIHTGEELTQPYVIYGNAGTPNAFNEVTYPGDRRNCLACHANAAAYTLPRPQNLIGVTAKRDYFTPMGPETSACLGCHDNRDAAAHAYLNTSPFGEACATCHGTGKDWDVAKEHAR